MADPQVLFDTEQEENQEQQQKQEEAKQSSGQGKAGPDQKLKSGSVHLDIWHNENSADTYSFKRFYTQDNGESFQETQNMRTQDLEDIKTLITKAQLQEVEER